jgi:hypothetical protein
MKALPTEGDSIMRYRILVTLILLSSCLPSRALAGRVFGDIKLGAKPVPAGTPVMIARAPAEEGKAKSEDGKESKPKPPPTPTAADTTKTDEFGAYKLMMKETGKCVLSVVYEKQTASLEVFSNKEATRYDLILEKKEGKLTLRRK